MNRLHVICMQTQSKHTDDVISSYYSNIYISDVIEGILSSRHGMISVT